MKRGINKKYAAICLSVCLTASPNMIPISAYAAQESDTYNESTQSIQVEKPANTDSDQGNDQSDQTSQAGDKEVNQTQEETGDEKKALSGLQSEQTPLDGEIGLSVPVQNDNEQKNESSASQMTEEEASPGEGLSPSKVEVIPDGAADLQAEENVQSTALSQESEENDNLNQTTAGAFTVAGGTVGTDYTYTINSVCNTLTIKNGANLTIKNTDAGTSTTDQIIVADGADVSLVLSGVNIDESKLKLVAAFKLGANATCHLTLAAQSTNILKSGEERAGLQVPQGATLTIDGTGALTAEGGTKSAGIGGNGACGNITINSGTVTAIGGKGSGGGGGGAGIGGGGSENGGKITINSGTVNAVGGGCDTCNISGGAGIGGAGGSNFHYGGGGGTILISGGIVNATGGGSKSSCGGAGIGGGAYGEPGGPGGSGGNITITGGTVTAAGAKSAAGIGGGQGGPGGTILISGGTVTATSDSNGGGAGIGGGGTDGWATGGLGGKITITGGVVTANGGQLGGAGIGSGRDGWGGDISISSGTVTATGSKGAGIGGGGGGETDGGKITITGGTVTATSSGDAGIGSVAGDDRGDFSTSGGNAFIVASTIVDHRKKSSWSGVIFAGENDGKVYGSSVALAEDAQIPSGKILIVDAGKTLTVNNGITLTVDNGSIITLENGGTLDNKGSVTVGRGSDIVVADNGNVQNSGGGEVLKSEQPVYSVAVSATEAFFGKRPLIIGPLDVFGNAAVTYSVVDAPNSSGEASDVASISGNAITLIKAGTFYVKAEIASTHGYEGKTVYSDVITVSLP